MTKFAEFHFPGTSVNRAERKGRGFYTRLGPNCATSLQVSYPSPPSSAGLVDPYAVPFDLLTSLLDVVPGVSSGAIRARATGDEVLAPIHSTDIVVTTLTVALVGAAAKVQRVGATPTVDAVSATVAVDSVIIRGAYKLIRSVIALDHCG
jgi:hypothetical protein